MEQDDVLYLDQYWPNVGDVLEHFGVKGMHWGVRKEDPVSVSRSSGRRTLSVPRSSEDARDFEKALDRIDRGGLESLSTRELQNVVNRMNLEQQYARLTSSGDSKNYLDEGNDVVKKLLGYGKTVNDVRKFMKSPTGKTLKSGFKNARKAAKFANAARKKNPVGAAVALVQ